MSATVGVNYSMSTEAARPVSVQSTTPLAIVGTAAGLEDGLHFFSSVTQAYDALKSKEGTLRMAIQAVYDQSVNTPVILSVFEGKTDVSKAKEAVGKLTTAEAETGFRPNIIIAPELSGDATVRSAMTTVAKNLSATAIADLDVADIPAVKDSAKEINTNRLILCYPSVLAWDSLV